MPPKKKSLNQRKRDRRKELKEKNEFTVLEQHGTRPIFGSYVIDSPSHFMNVVPTAVNNAEGNKSYTLYSSN